MSTRICSILGMVLLLGVCVTAQAVSIPASGLVGGSRLDGVGSYGNVGTYPDTGTYGGGIFEVDGVDHLYETYHYFAAGMTAHVAVNATNFNEASGGGISVTNGTASSTIKNDFSFGQGFVAGNLTVDFGWALVDPSAGDEFADYSLVITFTNNHTTQPMTFDWYTYFDVDVAGTAGGDSATFSSGTGTFTITDATTPIPQVMITSPNIDRWEIDDYATLRTKLNAMTTDIDLANANGMTGDGNVTLAMQFSINQLQPGNSAAVTMTVATPEVSTMVLFGLGLVGLGVFGWRRKRAAA